MALFSNKTPIENILGNFEKKHVDAIYERAARTIIDNSDFRNDHFAFALDAYKKKKLTELGIELYPNGYVPHSHPFSKILENHFLFDVLPQVLSNTNVIMCSIKGKKVEVFKGRVNDKNDSVTYVNRMLTGKDVGRYPEARASYFQANRMKPEVFSNNFIHTLMDKECVFFHDEVHHWGKDMMFNFLKRTRVKRLVFTIVYPPELLIGYANSQNPKLYDYKIRSGRLFFFPDGVQSEAYEQELNMEWLFKAAHLRSGEETWTVTRHKSAYAHHLFEITRGQFYTDEVLFFNDYSSVNMSKMFLNRFRCYEVFPVSLQHLYKVYSYLLCLKKPDLESGLAKLRQIIGDDIEIKEFMFFEQFCKRIIERQTSWGLFGHSLFEKLTEVALNSMPNYVARMFPSWRKKNTFEFLFDLGTLSIEIERGFVFECISEGFKHFIVSTDADAYLDPLQFFQMNDNFNDIRTDDGYIERFKVPGWGQQDKQGRPWKMNKFDAIAMNEQRRIDELKCRGRTHKPLLIRWKHSGPFFSDEKLGRFHRDKFGRTKEKKYTICENLLDSETGLNPIEQKKILGGLLSYLVSCGEMISKKEFDALLNDEIFAAVQMGMASDSGEDASDASDGHGSGHESTSSFAWDEILKGVANEGSKELGDEPHIESEEDERAKREPQISDEPPPKIDGELHEEDVKEDGTAEEDFIDYSRIFEKFEEEMPQLRIVLSPKDGNCFFHSIASIKKGQNHLELRHDFANWLTEFMEGKYSHLGAIIREEGVWIEAEMFLLFATFMGISIITCQVTDFSKAFNLHPNQAFICNSGSETRVFILQTGEHFDAMVEVELPSDTPSTSEGSAIDLESDDRLTKFKFRETDFRCFNWKTRRSAFFSKTDADYGHNGMKYPYNSWNLAFDEIIDICGQSDCGYNSALINFYDEGAKLPFHRDNEKVYGDHSILTVTTQGAGIFLIENKKKEITRLSLTPGSFFTMPKGFQREFRHSAESSGKRVSITFRRHIRKLNGSPVTLEGNVEEDIKGKNLCLLRALADGLKRPLKSVLQKLYSSDAIYWKRFIRSGLGGSVADCRKAANDLEIKVGLVHNNKLISMGSGFEVLIKLEEEHFSLFNDVLPLERSFVSSMVEKETGINVLDGLDEAMALESEGFNLLTFVAKKEYAVTLAQSFMSMHTGVCCSSSIENGKEIFKNVLESDEDELGSTISAICGFAGSGKSNALQNWLKERKKGNFCIVSPRSNLAQDWGAKMELGPKERRKVLTFETFLKQEKKNLDLIILDELTLFPNGYLDLILYELNVVNQGCKIFTLFDPVQARYHSKSDCDILTFDHEVDRILNGVDVNYLLYSYRLTPFFDCIFDVPCLNKQPFDEDRKIWILPSVFDIMEDSKKAGCECDVLLVDSNLEKKAFGSSIKAMTFGESQGLTFNHACVVLSEASANSDEFRWMVALTRSRLRVSFVCTTLGGIDEFLKKKNGGLIEAVLRGEKISVNTIRKMVSCNIIEKKPVLGGRDDVDREERLEGDPFLKPYIFLGQRVNVDEVEVDPVEAQEPTCQTHLFISEPNFALCYNYDLIRCKEYREYREDMMVTNQFCDSYDKSHPKSKMDTVGPMRFKAIYPKHSMDDEMTFWMAVRKRLVFREKAENVQRLERSHLIGGILYQNFKKTFGLEFRHDQQLLERCVNDFEVKKLQKSCGMIKSHSVRSDVDWPMNDVFLFMKSQLCTKFEKQFVDAKAGQTLACFQHLILVQFAPWCRYLESQIRSQLPEEIYIHSNKNFDDLDKWVKKFFQRDICVESDYEAFDASQDEYILSFELHLMKDAGFPDEVVDAYVDLKTDLGCKLGHFAVMRFTGEFCTFLFNTLANMAFTICRYEWRKGQPMAFAGDDMCALNNLSLRHDFDDIFDRLSLKAKVDRTETPMFCGWRLTPYGIVKEPELVYNRFQVAIEEGKVLECLENYAIEVSYAYRLSERLFEVLKSERQLQYHQAVVRFIVTHIDKLKTQVRELFIEQFSDEDI
ncbi:replicase polyprotein [Rudbeckia citrivirus A]|nr:replicase polyprotein [Rudbeckia citrivirus A]